MTKRLVVLVLAASGLLVLGFGTGCEPECVDKFDCRDKGADFVCTNSRCVKGEPAPAVDAGEDAGTTEDAGEPDAGEPDAGEADAGEMDAGEMDAGETDAGIDLDAGIDAGIDAGVLGDYTLDLTAFGVHNGQNVYLKVKNALTGVACLPEATATVSGSAATLTVPACLIEGVEYRADFYADLSGNQAYDAPPTDHSWRITFDAGVGNRTDSFTHNGSFTDLTPY